MPQILDGKVVRQEIFAGLRPRIQAVRATLNRPPGLAVVLVGEDPASRQYVQNKIKGCSDLGIYSRKVTPPATISTEGLLEALAALNRDPEIDAILVQMPLPKQIDSRRVLEAVAPEKDADGFHPLNVGHLVAGRPARALLGLGTPEAQLRLRAQILAQDWSVRATEVGVQEARPRRASRRRGRSPEIVTIEEELRHALGVRVRVLGNLTRGRIELSYANAEGLEALHARLIRGGHRGT